MENKVGDKLLTPQKASLLIKQLMEVLEQLRPYGITLAMDERGKALRPRKGAEEHMLRVHDLATKYNVSVKNVPLTGMANDLTLAKQFRPLEDVFRAGLTLTEDTGTQADSEAWAAFLAYYGVLQSMSTRDPELADALKPVVEFMANGPRTKNGAPAEAPTDPKTKG